MWHLALPAVGAGRVITAPGDAGQLCTLYRRRLTWVLRALPFGNHPGPAPGIKFVVLADPRQAGIDSLLRKIYEIYSDFALKNPFYSLEMPIR